MPVRQTVPNPYLARRRSSMFDKVSKWAERVATGVSRRAFLARMGLAPLAVAAFVGELAATPPTCIYQGGCCGGSYPYYSTVTRLCHSDRHCRNPIGCSFSERCCGGRGGMCNIGVCYSDRYCNTPC